MENAKRTKALRLIRYVSGAQIILSLSLFVLGLVASFQHGAVIDSVPVYYSGAFIAAPMILALSVIGLVIFVRGKGCLNKIEAAKQIGCLMETYCLITALSFLGYLVAMVIAGITGVCKNQKCSYAENIPQNYGLATTTLVFIVFAFVSNVAGLIIIYIHSSHFGLKIFGRGQFRIDTSTQPQDVFSTNIETLQPDPDNELIQAVHDAQNIPEPGPGPRLHTTSDYEVTPGRPEEQRWAYQPQAYKAIQGHQKLAQQYRRQHRKRLKRNKEEQSNKQNRARKNGNGDKSNRYALPPVQRKTAVPPPPSPSPSPTPPPPPPPSISPPPSTPPPPVPSPTVQTPTPPPEPHTPPPQRSTRQRGIDPRYLFPPLPPPSPPEYESLQFNFKSIEVKEAPPPYAP